MSIMNDSIGIKVGELTKRFPKVTAVDHISFECFKGEVFGLLGPNGAGKTTTIRMILGILEPTSGSVYINGIPIRENPVKVRLEVGAVLEETGVYDRLTGRENVLIFADYYGMKRNVVEKRLEEISKFLDMEDFLDRYGKEFSKGMRQKVALARALVSDPSILVLDEPTEGLDVPTRRAIIEMVKKEKERGKCILYSTHVMSEAEEVCDRLGVIFEGRLHFVGSMETLKSETRSEKLEEAFLKVIGSQWSVK